MDINARINELGIVLPTLPPKGGVYEQAKSFGENLIYVSGCGPDINGIEFKRGRLGNDLSIEEGQAAARNCALNILAILEAKLGDLSKIKSFAKLLVFVSSSSDFYLQPQTANAASQMLIDIFGKEVGCSARSAIGVSVLPGNIPIEIEALVEIHNT